MHTPLSSSKGAVEVGEAVEGDMRAVLRGVLLILVLLLTPDPPPNSPCQHDRRRAKKVSAGATVTDLPSTSSLRRVSSRLSTSSQEPNLLPQDLQETSPSPSPRICRHVAKFRLRPSFPSNHPPHPEPPNPPRIRGLPHTKTLLVRKSLRAIASAQLSPTLLVSIGI